LRDGSPITKFSEKNIKAEGGTGLLKISIYNAVGEKVQLQLLLLMTLRNGLL
jgi:hypothetical protein